MSAAFRLGYQSLKSGNYYCSLNPFCEKLQYNEHDQWAKGWYKAWKDARISRPDFAYIVTWIGDNDVVQEFTTKELGEACAKARDLELSQRLLITLNDVDGWSYNW